MTCKRLKNSFKNRLGNLGLHRLSRSIRKCLRSVTQKLSDPKNGSILFDFLKNSVDLKIEYFLVWTLLAVISYGVSGKSMVFGLSWPWSLS